MSTVRILSLLIFLAVTFVQLAPAQTSVVDDKLQAIFDRAIAKAQQGMRTEADLAEELNDLSDLANQYRSQRATVARILYNRADLYDKIIKDREMAEALYVQVAYDYGDTPAGAVAAETLAAARATADDAPPPRSSASSNRATTGQESTSAGRSGASGARSSGNNDTSRPTGTPKEGSVFPDFNVKDIDDTPLSLSQFAGKIILVDFWAAYNEASVSNIDAKMSVYRRYHDRGFEIIGINRDRDRAPMINFINERGITWPQFYDQGGQLSRRYNVTNVPASFLLDREGKVIATNVDLATLVRLLDRQINYGY